MPGKLHLEPGRWYGLLTLGAAAGPPPFAASPVMVEAVVPLKTGKGLLRLDVVRALAPRGPRQESRVVRVLRHAPDLMLVEAQEGPEASAVMAVTQVTGDWLRQHCHRLWARMERDPLTEWQRLKKAPAQDFLSAFLGDAPDRVMTPPHDGSFGCRKPPMPVERGMMHFRRNFDAMDAWLILRGSVPVQMEHKWFVVAEHSEAGGTIRFRRSWTGILVYEAHFFWKNDGIETLWSTVNLRPDDRKFGTREEEERALDGFLGELLLATPNTWGLLSEADRAAAHASWYGVAPPVGAPTPVPDEALAEQAAVFDFAAEGPPLADFALGDAEGRAGFLLRLSELGEPGLLAATAHVWNFLAPPRAARGTAMGLAAGVGGTGKKAVWKVLARMLAEFDRIGFPDLPTKADFASADLWHAAVHAHFARIDAAVEAVVAAYAAILNGDAPGAPPASTPAPPSAAVIVGPWRAPAPAPRPLPWLNGQAAIARLLDRFVAGVRARLGQPGYAAWLEREALRLNGLFLGEARPGRATHRVGEWNQPERLGRALVGLLSLEGPTGLAVRESLVGLANGVAQEVTCRLGEDERKWIWRIDGPVEDLTKALLGISPLHAYGYDDADAPANGGPGILRTAD